MPSHKSVCEFLISLYRRKHEKWIEFSIRNAKNVGRTPSFMNNFRPRALWSELYQYENICVREKLRHLHPCLIFPRLPVTKKEADSGRHIGTLLPPVNAVIIICARNCVRRFYRRLLEISSSQIWIGRDSLKRMLIAFIANSECWMPL